MVANFRESEFVLSEVFAMLVARGISEEDDVVVRGGGEGEGVFEVGGQFVEALWDGGVF